MTTITYNGTSITVEPNTRLLESLEKANFSIPYSCRAGVCHSCMMQSNDTIPANAQQGLSASQKYQGYFLACACIPENNMAIQLKGSTDLTKGQVVNKVMLNESVLALFIQVDFSWNPGQYTTLRKDELTPRAYSISSRCDSEKIIELHIQRHSQGLVSRWLHDDIEIGDFISLSTPLGDCFYNDDHHDKPIIMACTGTGLAPIYGVLQEALYANHSAPIYLYAAGGDPSRLYYRQQLAALAKKYENLHYFPVVKRDAETGMLEQDLVDAVKEQHPEMNGHKVFLCGAPDMVKKIQRACFFQGASISDILIDAFEQTKPQK